MTLLLSVMVTCAGGDAVVLKEKARAAGRYVRLLDLVDGDRLAEPARRGLAPVFLGRAPEEGQSRIITADEVRAELERRGIDPGAFEFSGDRVEVTAGASAGFEDALRSAIAFEIKRHLLEQEASRPDGLAVRVLTLSAVPAAEAEVVLVHPHDSSWTVVLAVQPEGKRMEVEVLVRILRSRDVVMAAREIAPGRALDRADLEVRRVELAEGDPGVSDLPSLLGSTALVRIRPGHPVLPADLRLKPIVRKGEVVRAAGADFEVDARAVEDGGLGVEIALEFLNTKNRFRAKVAAPGQVRVTEEKR